MDRLRDRRATTAPSQSATAVTFDALRGAEYALVVTFRSSGEAVQTPMRFGLQGKRVYVRSLADAGKVRRLRRDPRVRVAPCTLRDRPTGAFTEGVGRILDVDEAEGAAVALDRHYGLRRRLYEGLGSRLGVRTVYIEIARPPHRIDGAESPHRSGSLPRPACVSGWCESTRDVGYQYLGCVHRGVWGQVDGPKPRRNPRLPETWSVRRYPRGKHHRKLDLRD